MGKPHPPLRNQLTPCPEPIAWKSALAVGGGEGLKKALADPDAIVPTIEAAGLRGLGGAGFPTHLKWSAVAAQPPNPEGGGKWIVCNGNEDEPGTFKDRFLLSRTPHQVIEGALIAAVAVRANHIELYVNPREEQSVVALRMSLTPTRSRGCWSGLTLAPAGPPTCRRWRTSPGCCPAPAAAAWWTERPPSWLARWPPSASSTSARWAATDRPQQQAEDRRHARRSHQ